jgi:dipicolinate synthase subunit B
MSENAYYTDTRFQKAEEFSYRVETLCSRPIIHTVADAEPLGPTDPLDLLIVAPCTGNTLAKVAHGITDTAATMAIKAHLRADRPLLIALASNDAMSQNLGNIATVMQRKSVYFVPMLEDAPISKPHSLVAEFELMDECIDLLLDGKQMRPVFLSEKK